MNNSQLYNYTVARLTNPIAFQLGDIVKNYILCLPNQVSKETVHRRMELWKETIKNNIENDQRLSEDDKKDRKFQAEVIFSNAEQAILQQLSIQGRLKENF